MNIITKGAQVKTPQLAEMLGVSQRTIARWISEKRIPYYQVTPRTIFYDVDEVREALVTGEPTEGTGHFSARNCRAV